MRFLINSLFKKALHREKLGDEYIEDLLYDIFKNQGVSLGAGLYEIRGARKGQGKSGSYRNIFYWKKEDRIILAFLFPKGEMENLSPKDLKGLKLLANVYREYTDEEIDLAIKKNILMEVTYEK
jgi:hypothetical protein